MTLPAISGVGRLTADPELRFTPTGTQVAQIRLAFNSRKKVGDEWVDGDVCYLTGTMFGDHAERAVESLSKGVEVFVAGKLKTRKFTDKAGNERSVTDLMVDSIGPTVRYATVKVNKLQRKSEDAIPADDPWASAADPVSVGARGGFDDDTPPF